VDDPIEFWKLSGSGNDFICIDNRDGRYNDLLADAGRASHFAREICHRGTGVGADGVIFACRPEIEDVADIQAQFYEPDGSVAELCGNGTGCFVCCATALGWVDDGQIRILTPAGVVLGRTLEDHYVRVCIPTPEDQQPDVEVKVDGQSIRGDYIVTGVPHFVTYVNDVDAVDVAHLGPALRHHPQFAPRGVNANFVQVLGEGRLAVRTYEFGVENETLACGTGAASAALLAAKRFAWDRAYTDGTRDVEVTARSGDVLRVCITLDDNGTVTDYCLDTIVRFVCCGRLHPDAAERLVPDVEAR